MTDQPTSNITFHDSRYEFGEQVIRLDKEGFHYRGQFIADAGEAHRLMVEYLRQQTQPKPQGLAMRRLLNAPIDNRGYVDLRERSRPEPQGRQGPTDEELLDLGNDLMGDCLSCDPDLLIAFARAVLARWGRPAIEPVPVAERLPGPEDLTDEHFGVEWCWWGKRFAGGWEWHQGGTGYGTMPGEFSYWLPHHALPVPQQEADRG